MFGGIVVTKVADISVADVALADNIATVADVVHFTRYHSSSLSRNLIQSMVIERQNTLERTQGTGKHRITATCCRVSR